MECKVVEGKGHVPGLYCTVMYCTVQSHSPSILINPARVHTYLTCKPTYLTLLTYMYLPGRYVTYLVPTDRPTLIVDSWDCATETGNTKPPTVNLKQQSLGGLCRDPQP